MKARPGLRREPEQRRNREDRLRYFTSRWTRLRMMVLRRDRGLCQECLRNGKTETGNQVDHIRAAKHADELFWVQDNLQTLCRKCHTMKTMRGE